MSLRITCSFLLLTLLFCSCAEPKGNPYPNAKALYTPQYAQGFLLKQQEKERILYIHKSWQGNEQSAFTYLLYPRQDSLKYKGKNNAIPYPLKKIVCLSTTHIAYLDFLAQQAHIKGVSGAQYVSNPQIQNAIATGRVVDVGFEGALNYETLMSLKPDVIFAYGVAGESAAFAERLAQLSLQVVFVGDYLETHPLGKAEYMLAFAAFFEQNILDAAQAQFAHICSEYQALKATAEHISPKANVLVNAPFKDVWYIPGGDNYLSRLLADAGARSLGSKKGVRETTSISLEQAYMQALTADFWIHPNAFRSLKALEENDTRFVKIPAFAQHKIYNNTKRNTPQGGSDYWESGVVEPQVILADLIHIFHPQLLPQHELVYYEQLW